MKLGTVIAIIGALLAMIFAFANVGQYLTGTRDRGWLACILLLALAAIVGSLPGLIIRRLAAPRKSDRQ